MKNFFKKLGFHKMDEMEQHIAFKAQRNAFLFLELALLGWAFYESYKVYTYQTRIKCCRFYNFRISKKLHHASTLYPSPRTVLIMSGFCGSSSIFS